MAEDARRMLVEQLLAGARDQPRDQPHVSLAERVIGHAEQRFEGWLEGVLGPELVADEPALPLGRAAFLACGGPSSWPDLILADDNLPDAFVSAMRAALPPLSPLPAPATMTAQDLASWSIADAVRSALATLSGTSAWAAHARPLVSASIKLAKSWS